MATGSARLRGALGVIVGVVARVWAATWRVRILEDPASRLESRTPVVWAFWHGQQFGLSALCHRRRLAALVSWSRDGALQQGALRALGLEVVRGSSSRGGASGFRGMLRALGRGCDLAFAVDGPHGPRERAKGGAARLAAHAGVRLVPAAAATSRRLVLTRAWDRFEIPWPFSRVVIRLGAPLDAARTCCEHLHLERALATAQAEAEAALGGRLRGGRRLVAGVSSGGGPR